MLVFAIVVGFIGSHLVAFGIGWEMCSNARIRTQAEDLEDQLNRQQMNGGTP